MIATKQHGKATVKVVKNIYLKKNMIVSNLPKFDTF